MWKGHHFLSTRKKRCGGSGPAFSLLYLLVSSFQRQEKRILVIFHHKNSLLGKKGPSVATSVGKCPGNLLLAPGTPSSLLASQALGLCKISKEIQHWARECISGPLPPVLQGELRNLLTLMTGAEDSSCGCPRSHSVPASPPSEQPSDAPQVAILLCGHLSSRDTGHSRVSEACSGSHRSCSTSCCHYTQCLRRDSTPKEWHRWPFTA